MDGMQSVPYPKELQFARARIENIIAKEYMNKEWSHPTLEPQKEPPPLPAHIVNSIPGAQAALGDAAAAPWKVCAVRGGKLCIQDEHKAGFLSSPTAIKEAFLALETKHDTEFKEILSVLRPGGREDASGAPQVAPTASATSTSASSASSAQAAAAAQEAELPEFDSEEAAADEAGGIGARSSTAVSGASLLRHACHEAEVIQHIVLSRPMSARKHDHRHANHTNVQ